MEYVSPTPWLDAIVFGLVLAAIITIAVRFWIPPRAHVFLRQCCRGFMPIFTGWTKVKWTTKYPVGTRSVYAHAIKIPNALILGSYLFCCVMSVILLP